MSAAPGASAGSTPSLSDLAGHWSRAEVTAAVAEGWVNGYPEGLFRPEGTVTRAEFVKVLAAATRLTPGSETARALEAAAAPYIPEKPEDLLTDLKGHWLAADLGFKDRSGLPAWVRGYVKQAVQAGILTGYPDGTFGGDRSATRAEAVVIARRVLAAMAAGADPGIRVFVTRPDQEPSPVDLAVPARFIDGRVYVPARSVFQTLHRLRTGQQPAAVHRWDPSHQQFIAGLAFTAGTDSAAQQLQMTTLERRVVAPARVAFGELILPVRLAGSDSSPFYKTGTIFWEPESKRLTIYALEEFETGRPS